MPNFQPAGIIHIGNVPFTNDYINVRLFDSKIEQQAWFLQRMTRSLSKESYTYVRMNNAIRVQGNAEDLYTYDYVMYKNANYGDKWFYAFITQVNYINENCTEFILELDIMQTWMFDYTLKMGYVEREHVSNDSIGVNLNAEPEFNYNTVVQSETLDPAFNNITDYNVIVETTKWFRPNQSGIIGTIPLSGYAGIYQNVYTGSTYLSFDYTNATDMENLKNGLYAMNSTGEANSIVSMFLFPKLYTPPVQSSFVPGMFYNQVTKGTAPIVDNGMFEMPNNIDGYVPRNNKLFTFPYCYPAFTDMNGNYKEYKFELWQPVYNQNTGKYYYNYTKRCILDASGEMYITPQYYDGVTDNYAESYVFKFENRLSWLYYGFENWLAQNSMRLVAQAVTGGIGVANNMYVSNVNRDIYNQSMIENMLRSPDNNPQHGSMLQEIRGRQSYIQPYLTAFKIGATTPLNILNEVYTATKTPNERRGSSTGNGRFAYNINSYSARIICLQHQFAERLDSFFDRYGYAIELTKLPNIRSRRGWNFIKMQNAAHYGNVPNSDMDAINAIFNRGVTFWHIDNIGDYSQSNTILPLYDQTSSIPYNAADSVPNLNPEVISHNENAGGIGDNTGTGGSNNEGAGGAGDNTGSNNENAGGIGDNTGTGGSNNEGAGGIGDNTGTGGSNNEGSGGIGDNTGTGGSNNEGAGGIGDNTGGSNNENAGGIGDNTGGSNNSGSIFNP